MIRRRAAAAGIAAEIGCHTFRATGITAYLANGGALEHAQEMAAHESPRTTKLYDRTEMLRGFYQYFRLHHCQEKLDWIRREVQLQWRRTLRQHCHPLT